MSFKQNTVIRYMHDTVIAVSLLIVASLALACNSNEQTHATSPEEVAISYVQMIDEGRIDEAVNLTAGCDSTTNEYNLHIAQLYKQMADNTHKEFGNLETVKTLSVNHNKKQNFADVYLCLTYDNGSSNNVLLQLVYTKGRWFVK